ncbi:hypothetical protein INT43_003875 [Umbelopsis isabellina]|uniref:Arrestin C-terminal-like domain-containing protein n=1 Tax=Mortierella isabellina TaxID=91625 RepID=A0A8H7PTK0_MORIS|nr:hypothetical protein INT43_003875 [Umbelopsis isabellina]
MRIITRRKQNSSFYITLDEERYYFPGDCIRGKVTLHLQKPCKTASIRVCLWGKVATLIKDRKEEFPLFQKEIMAFQLPGGKSTVLEPRIHSYPFEFIIPTDLSLPSFMEQSDYPEGSITYAIQAIHDRPFVADILAQKAQLHIPLLEKIDVMSQQYQFAQEANAHCMFDHIPAEDGQNAYSIEHSMQAAVNAMIPRIAYVRGETIPVNVSIHHIYPFSRVGGLTISLCRAALFANGSKTYITPEIPVKTIKCDINVTDPRTLTQNICEQLLVPSTTPPTIDSNGRLLQVQYKIVITAELSDMNRSSLLSKLKNGNNEPHSPLHIATLHLPVKLGTLPFASMPIDPEEFGDDITEAENQSQVSEGSTIVFGIEKSMSRKSSISVPNIDLKRIMSRSDSINSYSSITSTASRQSWRSAPSGLSRNTSSTSTNSTPLRSHNGDPVPLYIMKELPTSPITTTSLPCDNTPVFELQEMDMSIPNMTLQPLQKALSDLSMEENSYILTPITTSPTDISASRRETWPSIDVQARSSIPPATPPHSTNTREPAVSLRSADSVRSTASEGRRKPFTTIFRDELSSDDEDAASYDTHLSSTTTLVDQNHVAPSSNSSSRNTRSTSEPALNFGNGPSPLSRRPLSNFTPFQGASHSDSESEASEASSDDESDADDPVVILSKQRKAAAKANKKRFMTIQR